MLESFSVQKIPTILETVSYSFRMTPCAVLCLQIINQEKMNHARH